VHRIYLARDKDCVLLNTNILLGLMNGWAFVDHLSDCALWCWFSALHYFKSCSFLPLVVVFFRLRGMTAASLDKCRILHFLKLGLKSSRVSLMDVTHFRWHLVTSPAALLRKRAMDGCPAVCILSSALYRVHGLRVLKRKLSHRSSNLPVFVSHDVVFKCEGTGHLNRNYVYCCSITPPCFCPVLYLLMWGTAYTMWKQDHFSGLTGERSNRFCGLRLRVTAPVGSWHKKRHLFSTIHSLCVCVCVCRELQNILLRIYSLLPIGQKVVISVTCVLNIIFNIEAFVVLHCCAA
jgi:hypothetical protein